MTFDRHDRAKSVLMEVVATFIRNEANQNPLITVTNLRVSPDSKNLTVLFTTIPDGGEGDALIFLKRKGRDLRTYIKKHSRLRVIPNVDFEIDWGERHRQHIDEITHKIEGEKKEEK